jgi:hypothetical protein
MGVLIMLVYLLFGALLVWLTAKIKGVKISYGKSYQIGMHLMTSVIIITNIFNIIPTRFIIPFLFTILLILSAVLNLRKNMQQSNISSS